MRILFKSFMFSGLLALAVPAFAQIHLSINFGPPAPRYEVRPRAPFSGAIWIGGFYLYNDQDRNYQWTPGRWEAPPSRGEVWVAPRYVRNGNSYDYYQGRWGTATRARAVSAPRRTYRSNAVTQHYNGKQNGNFAHGNSGHGNSGHGNSGHGNSGHGNSGHGNSAHGNKGR
ncbi:MAG TPA: pentapeptide repeat-containing protein [Candidatus Kapabacteria bacterium]|nr:pentapeptide repeat-containing protein [Candidatus Kapabacteria bacterium]